MKEQMLLRLDASSPGAEGGRVPGLDGLRAASILLVICGHFFDRGGAAAFGVYVFFAISGFLIARLLFLECTRDAGVNIGHFYLRRARRLYPVLIAYLMVVTIIQVVRSSPTPIHEYAAVVFYYTNYLLSYGALQGEAPSMPIGILWSLAVEEHFYLIMPVFFVLFKGRPRAMLLFSLVALLVPLCLRLMYVYAWPETVGKLVTYRNSETRFDSIGVGVLLACVCELRMGGVWIRWFSSRSALVLSLLLLAVSYINQDQIFKETIRFTLLNVVCMVVTCVVVFGEGVKQLQRALNNSVVVWIGQLSYSLYVWHGITGIVCALIFGKLFETSVGPFLGLVVNFCLAAASYYLVEKPFLGIRLPHERAKMASKLRTT